MSERLKAYLELLKDNSYVDVRYNPINEGLMATHVEHKFHPHTGRYEKEAQRVLFEKGNKVILGSEVAPEGVKTPDGYLNDTIFDIKAVLGLGRNNIKNKLNEARSQGCRHVVLYYPPELDYEATVVDEGYYKYRGALRKAGLADPIQHLWVVKDDSVFVHK